MENFRHLRVEKEGTRSPAGATLVGLDSVNSGKENLVVFSQSLSHNWQDGAGLMDVENKGEDRVKIAGHGEFPVKRSDG